MSHDFSLSRVRWTWGNRSPFPRCLGQVWGSASSWGWVRSSRWRAAASLSQNTGQPAGGWSAGGTATPGCCRTPPAGSERQMNELFKYTDFIFKWVTEEKDWMQRAHDIWYEHYDLAMDQGISHVTFKFIYVPTFGVIRATMPYLKTLRHIT